MYHLLYRQYPPTQAHHSGGRQHAGHHKYTISHKNTIDTVIHTSLPTLPVQPAGPSTLITITTANSPQTHTTLLSALTSGSRCCTTRVSQATSCEPPGQWWSRRPFAQPVYPQAQIPKNKITDSALPYHLVTRSNIQQIIGLCYFSHLCYFSERVTELLTQRFSAIKVAFKL